ncbi:MAG: excinuclease ABC subunit UvrC [Chloroflexi bacterium]|nr:excinuclease ABC subunit UvrC [Chloroflexota bacterium]
MEPEKSVRLLAATPTKPGVYLMKDAKAQVLYVGKAANLRNRLRSYFGNPGEFSLKIAELMPRVEDFEYIVTDSEAEALLLENTLIKKHKPRFNIRLKDDKTYPYIKVTLAEDFPRLEVTRRVASDGNRYFGPFASASSMRKTMAMLKRLFPYRTCTKAITGKDARPCLEYYIHRCVAPCVGLVNKEQYAQVINQTMLFLDGRHESVLEQLKGEMEQAAESLKFERAAALRDQIKAVERVSEEQKAVSLERQDKDILAVAAGDDEAWVEVFFIRQGKLSGRDSFIMEGTKSESPGEVLAAFVTQFYPSASFVPPEVLLQHTPPEVRELEALISRRRGKPARIKVPERGASRRLMELVARNAKEGLEQRRVKWMADREKVGAALEELQEALSLPGIPRRIETYDISNIQGTSAVGSMVVFEEGQAKSSLYRRFKIRTVEGSNDYAMMKEMLRRRFGRGEKAKEQDSGRGWGAAPDLVIIDGGKGHLNAALEVMLEIGKANIPLASIAKREEEIFIPDSAEPIVLPRNSQSLYLVQRMRDEAHRFAITYHRTLRSKRSARSVMDEIPGIGPRKKKALMLRFGSVQGIREAPVDEVAAVMGMTRSLAERVKAAIG